MVLMEWTCTCPYSGQRWKLCPKHDPREKAGAA